MSFPKYEHYKDSGVEWLGEVPAHWDVAAVGYRYQVLLGKMLDERRITGNHLAPYLRNVDVQWDRINIDALPEMDFSGDDIERYGLTPGDLLVCEGGEVGRAAIWQGEHSECYYQKALHRLRQRDKNMDHPRFMFYLLRMATSRGVFEAGESKATIAHLTAEALRRYRFGFPPQQEQQQIFTFLDAETTKLDALITEQRTLIDLLKEKRQAVISHAVTKGLDPRVPMKDSGVEWLGEVPAHWDFFPIKRELQFLTSGSRGWADHYADEGPLFIRIGNLTRDDVGLDLSDIQRVQIPQGSEGERTRVQPGDVLFSITAYIGSVAVVPENLETAYVSQHVALARLNAGKLLPEWVAYFAKSLVGKIFLENQGYGGTKVQLSLDDVANLPVTVPPLDEQHRVVSSIREETARLNALTAEAQTTIALLQERRSALISAAVTGKIDVRGT